MSNFIATLSTRTLKSRGLMLEEVRPTKPNVQSLVNLSRVDLKLKVELTSQFILKRNVGNQSKLLKS